MKKKIFLLILGLASLIQPLKATHFMGGEITWECLPNGNYRFIMKLYRECGSSVTYSNPSTLETNVPGFSSGISLYLWPNATAGKVDMSPPCNINPSYPHIACATIPGSNMGAVEEWTFTSDQAYPNGVNFPAGPIPASGWYFANQSCCRNPCSNIVNATGFGWYLRALMYPYPSQSPDNCWDNSPKFAEKPSTVICAGFPFTYNPNGYDLELDSLAFAWAEPLDDPSGGIITAYAAGYSFNSPLPGTMQNPANVPAVVNPYTGEISFTSYTTGAFVTVNKVTAYRCGVKIAEIFREMQVVLLACPGSNLPPNVTAPFQNPNTGLYTEYLDTVFAGSIIDFYLYALDTDYLNNGLDPQNLEILASGLQFGTNFTSSTTGCLNPPCATLDPPPPAQGVAVTATHFVWQTTCDHLATENPCGGITNIYTFVLRVKDDYCPAPAYQWKTVTIVVRNPIMLPPRPRCISVLDNGYTLINFLPSDTSYYPNTWQAYYIYRAKNQNGPFTLIDSIVHDPANNVLLHNTTTYLDAGTHAQDTVYYYYFKSRSGCYGDYYSGNSDTIHTTRVDATSLSGSLGHLTWTYSHYPPFATATGWTHIYRQISNGNWIRLDTIQGQSTNVNVTGCGYVRFRVHAPDSSGCESISAIDSALFQAAKPPRLQCVAVEPGGQVKLSYLPPADSGTMQYFSAYLIYYASSPFGPYTLIDSILDPSLNSYTINNVNANQQQLYFYMINRINCDGPFNSIPSDTLRTIWLTISNVSQSVNTMNWTTIRDPLLPTSSDTYHLYRHNPGGPWTLVGTTTGLTMTDSLILCGDSVPYRVEIYDSSGCWSVSNVRNAFYEDKIKPPIPILDTVSVDSLTGFVRIGWLPNNPETIGYIIFYNNNGTWERIDTVYGTYNTFYIDSITPGNACDRVKEYILAAIDSCWNTSPMGDNNIHNTMKLQITAVDPCEANISIDWNPYNNMKNNLAAYRLYISENWGPKVLLTTLYSPGPGNPPPSQYVFSGYKEKSWYCFSVQAVNQDSTKTSTTCEDCIYATKPRQPKFNYLRLVTVEDDDHVRLKFVVDTSAYVKRYRILRANKADGPYSEIAILPSQNTPEVEYLDLNTHVSMFSYFYYISVIDSCGLEAVTSDTSRTILLKVNSNENMTNTVLWNDYEGWTWSYVNSYNLFRGIDGMTDPIPIATLPYGSTQFIDDVSRYIQTQGKFRYFVEATEGPGLLPYIDTSYSNTASDMQRTRLWIPNAFSPKGYNSIFKPVGAFIDKEDYYFVIWDRWGEKLFETDDPEVGWDGKYKGEYVPLGVYVYYIRCHTSEGEKLEQRKTVTVIK